MLRYSLLLETLQTLQNNALRMHIIISVSIDGGNEPVQDGSDGLPYNNTIYILVERPLSAGRLVGLRLFAKSRSPIKIQIWKRSGEPTLESQNFMLKEQVEFTPPTPGYYRVSESYRFKT
jgi:hypothetical protein